MWLIAQRQQQLYPFGPFILKGTWQREREKNLRLNQDFFTKDTALSVT